MRRAYIGMLVVLVGSATALPSYGATKEDRTQARAIFKRSADAYDAGRFDEAVKLIQAAYLLDPNPILLYNLARAQEGDGDWAGAVESYRRYLDVAEDTNDRAFVERKVETLEAQLDRERTLEEELRKAREAVADPVTIEPTPVTPPPPPVAAPPLASAVVVEAPVDVDESGSVLPWVVMGTGLAVVVGGGVVAMMSRGRRNAGLDEPAQVRSEELQLQGNQLAITADVLFIAGGVAVLGGLIWGVAD